MKFFRIAGILLMVVLCQAPLSLAKPLQFKVSENGGSKIAFTSNAPVEVINGTTDHVTGTISLDDSFKFDAKHPFDIHFSVDLNTLKTGIPLRDEHMRDNFLETSQFGKATFKTTGLQLSRKPDLSKPQSVNLTAVGDFNLHGVTVRKTVPLKVDYRPASGKTPASVKVTGKFPVPLTQHQIKRPEVLFKKLADTVYVDLNLAATAQ